MEVGAVKQAFNNEVILLKKNLNQAKIQIIHKLTRKAKTLTEKKAPEHLKDKLKRKAESAVNEVLIIKKIKPRDIAKFIITHKGEVKDYINRPKVDDDKACARLVLHKSLQDKYKLMRNRFQNVPINDLFMSRQERRKLKKEAKEQQKNKKKRKEAKVSNSTGDWDIEDVDGMGDSSKDISHISIDSDENRSEDQSDHSDIEENEGSGEENNSETETEHHINKDVNPQSDDTSIDNGETEYNAVDNEQDVDSDQNDTNVGRFVKLPQMKTKNVFKTKHAKHEDVSEINITKTDTFRSKIHDKQPLNKKVNEKKHTGSKVKENKNKNFKEKLLNRQFKKDRDDALVEGKKVVDPFFITATGEKYLSLAEPRLPDEVKEIHKQGNRQERRAAMFGHVPKKPRRDNFDQNDNRSNKFERNNGPSNGFRNSNGRLSREDNFSDRNNKFSERNNKFNDRNDKFNGRNNNYSDRNSDFNKISFNNVKEQKEEKLHPSWEAKRKLKSMTLLPAQGKKIVFDNN